MIIDNIKKLNKTLNSNNVSIYCFHGVIKNKVKSGSVRNYNSKHLDKKKFEKYIKFLSKKGNAITLNDIVNNNIDTKKNYIVTFDDGYYNNYKYAVPILKKYSIPHIIYLTTNYVDKNLITWSDRIDIAVDECKKNYLYSNIFKKKFKLRSKKNKIIFLDYIRNYCKSLKKVDLHKFADILLKDLKLKSPKNSNSDLDKKLEWKHVIKMNKNNLTEFGGHSHNHNILNHLTKSQYTAEIKNSLNYLLKKANIMTKHYSYPEGFKSSYNKNIIELLKKNKIQTCVTTFLTKRNKKSKFELNRFFII